MKKQIGLFFLILFVIIAGCTSLQNRIENKNLSVETIDTKIYPDELIPTQVRMNFTYLLKNYGDYPAKNIVIETSLINVKSNSWCPMINETISIENLEALDSLTGTFSIKTIQPCDYKPVYIVKSDSTP
jgi:hypothetical protein